MGEGLEKESEATLLPVVRTIFHCVGGDLFQGLEQRHDPADILKGSFSSFVERGLKRNERRGARASGEAAWLRAGLSGVNRRAGQIPERPGRAQGVLMRFYSMRPRSEG